MWFPGLLHGFLVSLLGPSKPQRGVVTRKCKEKSYLFTPSAKMIF